MKTAGSVTRLADQLRSDDVATRDEAARQIWQRYFPRLMELACKHLAPRVRRREDEEDVLQSMYKSFCLRLGRGDFALGDRTDLWRLLVTMTLNKARGAATRQRRHRRDYRREEDAGPAGADDSLAPEGPFARMEQSEPTPAEAAALSEELERRLESLPPDLRRIALWKLEGFTSAEIAEPDRLDCAERTVERKLALIRKKWEESP
jgi:RNA polymerase sigma factor (sigma-70 family)